MHAIEEHAAMAEVVITKLKEIMPTFERGKDLLTLEIYREFHKDPSRLFCLNEFLEINKSVRKIRSCVDRMVSKGLVKKLGSYPRFYCLVVTKREENKE